MTKHSSLVLARRTFGAVCLVVLVTFGWSASVSAHTDFVASIPADGATVDGPLSSITIEFTNPAVESGDGFQLLEPDGTVRIPQAVDPTDGTTFVVSFDPALEAGTYGFRWEVQAGDAHPIQGSFQFTVGIPSASATSPSAPGASTPVAVAPASTAAPVDHSAMSMHEFMTNDDAPGPIMGRAARTMTIGATVFAVGVLAALVWVIRGHRDDIGRLLGWVRLAGLGLITGGITALAALDETLSESLSDTATSKPGGAALLTMAGGLLVYVGFAPTAGKIVGQPRSLSAAVAADAATSVRPERSTAVDPAARREQFRWAPDATATAGGAGIVLALGAYWFDGHTVSRGPWIVHAAVNLVHVTSASLWVGGVIAMTMAAWMRRRRRADSDLAAMIIRFSTIAAVSLAALSVAGVVMAWLVLDTPGDLFSTDWGQVLLVKIGAVAVAAGLGGYNHFVLRPALEAGPDDPEVAAHLRVSLLIESVIMVAVIVITAVLVASST